jgi:hypothetical protein
MIMSYRKLNRNVLFSKKVIRKRQLLRRCLNGRRIINYEQEGTFPAGRGIQGEGEANDYKGGIRTTGNKLPAMPADMQAVCGGGG